MKEFSDSLPAFEPEHLWLLLLNMFNYLRKYICVEEVFIQHSKSNNFKIEKKTSIEAQSEGHALVNYTKQVKAT